jgi:hypothetical protein
LHFSDETEGKFDCEKEGDEGLGMCHLTFSHFLYIAIVDLAWRSRRRGVWTVYSCTLFPLLETPFNTLLLPIKLSIEWDGMMQSSLESVI